MTSPSRRVLLALLATSAASLAHAQLASKLTTTNIAVEVSAGSIVLPLSATSAATFRPCADCAPKSFPTTASTAYYLEGTPVSLDQLKAAVAGHPERVLTAVYSVKTGELVRITAGVDAPH